ncbi:MAG: Fe-S cluster assembly protein SufD [Acidimicrobiales bacterium]
MPTFDSGRSSELAGPKWLKARRAAAFERLSTLSLPTADGSEAWRYSPIDEMDLDSYFPAPGVASSSGSVALGQTFGSAVGVLHAGRLVALKRGKTPAPVRFEALSSLTSAPSALGSSTDEEDYFVSLNDAFVPDGLYIEVPGGVVATEPIVIVHWCDAGSPDGPVPTSFPRTVIDVGEEASASVIEVVAGPDPEGASLVAPVTEIDVADRGELSYVMLQDLGEHSWQLARLSATLGAEGTLSCFTAGLGGAYDRCRLDSSACGPDSRTALTSVYLGSGDQIHDVRTLQDHFGRRTKSDLLCKGAVAQRSRSIYSGLIRVRQGAVRTDAMQTNHNLVLDTTAHADSVPNLDIQENDVRCSHASSIGPIDEDQRYYLESRGLSPEQAQRLIVLGFFDDVVARAPVPAAVGPIRQRIGLRLEGLLGSGRDA